jgi:hypothetical protein
MKIGITFVAVLVALTMLAAGCLAPAASTPAGSATTSTPTVQPAATGTVQFWVTDAPRSDNISEIWVTVSDVEIHEAASGQASDNGSNEVQAETDNSTGTTGWVSANLTGENRFDLLKLRGENGEGIEQILASANLSAGRYTQIRMSIEKVEVNIDGVLKDAILPSGKLKFVHAFDIQAGGVTNLLFDFNAAQFVTITGSPTQPRIIVRPVVKMIVSGPQTSGTPSASAATMGGSGAL